MTGIELNKCDFERNNRFVISGVENVIRFPDYSIKSAKINSTDKTIAIDVAMTISDGEDFEQYKGLNRCQKICLSTLDATGKVVRELSFHDCELIGNIEEFDYNNDSIHTNKLIFKYNY